jgi:2-iminobutanoate/2-iminopropanoate deaminase
MRSALLLLGTLPLVLTILGDTGDTELLKAGRAVPEPASPVAEISNDFFYTGGVVGDRPDGAGIPEGVEAQIRQALENVQGMLRAEGMDLSHVVRSNVFLTDTRHFQEMNAVYRTFFPEDPPTRATVRADLPLKGALVQVAMVAARPGVERTVVTPRGMRTPDLPYSWGILAGNTLFVAGATSRNPETYEPVGGDIATQTRQVLHNVGAVLAGAGMDYEDVTSCNVFLDDPRDFSAMNEVYATFFTADPPARATVRAGLMNPVFRAEIQCVAVRGDSRKVVVAEGAVRSTSPFSPAIQVGADLYLAGMVGRGPTGYAPGDVEAQTRQTLTNIQATLYTAEMSFADVSDIVAFVTDIRHAPAIENVIRELMPSPLPALTLVGSQLMSPDALVEIMMTAGRR